MKAVSAADVRSILAGLAQQSETVDREGPTDELAGLTENIDLTVDDSERVIHCRITTGV